MISSKFQLIILSGEGIQVSRWLIWGKKYMKRIVITYGVISGLITGGLMLATMPLYDKGILNFDNGALVGYTGMVISLSLVFFGIKSFRDNQAGGSVTFGKAVLIGMLITMIASVFYAMAWEVSYANMGDRFVQQWTDHALEKLQTGGATEADIQAARADWKSFGEMYKNPLIRFGMTLFEILPVGLVISLVSAALLRRKEFLPMSSNS
jgi:Protein of unknown function (DUF4199)